MTHPYRLCLVRYAGNSNIKKDTARIVKIWGFDLIWLRKINRKYMAFCLCHERACHANFRMLNRK